LFIFGSSGGGPAPYLKHGLPSSFELRYNGENDAIMAVPPWRERNRSKEWGFSSWQEFVRRIGNTKRDLVKKEKEYRDVANVILQVGIGWGGMWLGLLGIVLSLVIPWLMP
jgi:hypothetical protein